MWIQCVGTASSETTTTPHCAVHIPTIFLAPLCTTFAYSGMEDSRSCRVGVAATGRWLAAEGEGVDALLVPATFCATAFGTEGWWQDTANAVPVARLVASGRGESR